MLLWAESGMPEKLAAHVMVPDSENPAVLHAYQLYGDVAYGLGPHILRPFPETGIQTEYQFLWNSVMEREWVSVKNAFAIVTNMWPFLQVKWKMQVYQSPVGRFYQVGVLLANAVNCYIPNQIAQ